MKKGLIIYQSKYGATQKYAKWLQEATGYDCIRTKDASVEKAAQYKTIVLCGGIYASSIAGLSFLKKNFSIVTMEDIIEAIKNEVIPGKEYLDKMLEYRNTYGI